MSTVVAGSGANDGSEVPNQSTLVARSRVAPVASIATPRVDNITSMNMLFSSLTEDIVLSLGPQAGVSVNGQTGTVAVLALQDAPAWEQVKTMIASLGFQPDSGEAWEFLGLYKRDGPLPTNEDINNRLKAARQLAQDATLSTRSAESKQSAQAFIDKAEGAASTCLQELPQVIKDRKKLAKALFTWRWMEICPDFLFYLANSLDAGGGQITFGLHLSNLLGVDFASHGGILPLEEARRTYQLLHNQAPTVAMALQGMSDKHMVLWAPTDNQRLMVLLNEIHKVAKTKCHDLDLRLVVPYDPMPGCKTVGTLQELWSHPLTQPKFKQFIQSVHFYEQPMRCVFTGAVGPLHFLKSLMIVRCRVLRAGIVDIGIPPSIVPWKSTLLSRDVGIAIIVDSASERVFEAVAALNQLDLPGLLGWDQPQRSPAHTPGAPRQSIMGFFDPDRITPLELSLYVRALKSESTLQDCFVGSQSLFEDKTSYVVECGDVLCLLKCMNMIQEVVVVSKKRAVISTGFPKHMWEEAITQQNVESPMAAVSVIRFRKSLQLQSHVWLKPLLLQDAMQTARQRCNLASRASREQETASLHAQLRIEGLPHVEHESMCGALMDKVMQVTKINLCKAPSSVPGVGQWAISYRSGGEFAQQIAVQLDSKEALKQLIMHVHGSGVRVNDRNLVVEVKSIHPELTRAVVTAQNFVTPVSSSGPPTGGGTCL